MSDAKHNDLNVLHLLSSASCPLPADYPTTIATVCFKVVPIKSSTGMG
jgi:hypothetical protein